MCAKPVMCSVMRFYLQTVVSCRPQSSKDGARKTWDDQLWLFGRNADHETVSVCVRNFSPSILVNIDGWEQHEIDALVDNLNNGCRKFDRQPDTVVNTSEERLQNLVGFDNDRKIRYLRIHYRNPSALGRHANPRFGYDASGMYKVLDMTQNLSPRLNAVNLEVLHDDWSWEHQFLFSNQVSINSWVDVDVSRMLATPVTNKSTVSNLESSLDWQRGCIRPSGEAGEHVMLNAAVSIRVFRSNPNVSASFDNKQHVVTTIATKFYWTGAAEKGGPESVCFTAGRPTDQHSGDNTVICRDEKEMFAKWFELLAVRDPDNFLLATDTYNEIVAFLASRAPNNVNLTRFTWTNPEARRGGNSKVYVRTWGRGVFDIKGYLQKEYVSPPLSAYTLEGASEHKEFYTGVVPEAFKTRDPRNVKDYIRLAEGRARMCEECIAEVDVMYTIETNRNAMLAMYEVCAQTGTELTKVVSGGQVQRVWNKFCQQGTARGFAMNKARLAEPCLIVKQSVANSFVDPPDLPNISMRTRMGEPEAMCRPSITFDQRKADKAAAKKRKRDAPAGASLAGFFGNPSKRKAAEVEDDEDDDDELKDSVKDVEADFGNDGTFTGGYVHKPMAGFYTKPYERTATLDFASLYPSIIMGYLLCYSSLLYRDYKWIVDEPERGRKFLAEKGWSLIFVPIGPGICCVYVTGMRAVVDASKKTWEYAGGPNTLMPATIRQLVDQRKKVKRMMKNATGFLAAVYNSQQLGCKVLQNAMYGFLGARRGGELSNPVISASVCAIGQWMNKVVKHRIQSKWNGTVVYGDTDSVMVQVPPPELRDGESLAEAYWRVFDVMASDCNDLYPLPNDLENEGNKYPFLLLKKKNYAYIGYSNARNPNESDGVHLSGLAGKKRDRCPIVRETTQKIVEMILEKRTDDEVTEYIDQQLTKLTSRSFSMSDLVITCEMASTYKTTHAIQLDVARKMVHIGRPVEAGMRIAYVLVRGDDDKPEGEIPDQADPKDIDVVAYLDSQFRNSIDTITSWSPGIATRRIYDKHMRLARLEASGQADIGSFFTTNA